MSAKDSHWAHGHTRRVHVPREKRWSWTDVGGLLVLIGFGALLLWPGRDAASAFQVFGAGCIGLGAVLGVGEVLRWSRRSAPEPALAPESGNAATVVLRDRAEFLVGMAALGEMTLTCVAWIVLALATGYGWWAFLPAAAAVMLMAPVVLALRGRYVAGGLWLTPDSLTYRSHGLQSTTRWEDIGEVAVNAARRCVVIRSVPGASVVHEFRAGPWRGERAAAPGVGILRTEGLALDPAELELVVEHYTHRPEARAELGTAASLTTITTVSGGVAAS